jgi:hypothetical protein
MLLAARFTRRGDTQGMTLSTRMLAGAFLRDRAPEQAATIGSVNSLEQGASSRDDVVLRPASEDAGARPTRRGAMSEPDPIHCAARGAEPVRLPVAAKERISFDRQELREIFNVYGRMVVSGEWRDYAVDFLRDRAVFSVFRRASEVPLYRIVKDPSLARRQGVYAVITATGLIVRRGHELRSVLRVLEKPLRLVS